MQKRIRSLKEKTYNNSEAVLIVLLILFYLTEGITKITVFSNLEKIEIQAGVKTLVLGLALLGLFFYKRKELLFICILTIIFIIGQINLPNSFEFSVLVYFMKYIFPIALLGAFTIQLQKPKLKLMNTFEYVLLFNSVLVIIGMIFEVTFFKTYEGSRFGYSGILVTSAASTYFYVIGLCYFLARYRKGLIANWKFWFVAVTAVVVGTKSIMLVLAVIGFIYIIEYVPSRKLKMGLLAIIVSMTLAFGYYLFFINPLFQTLTENEGVLTSFLSLRDQLFLDFTLPYIQENWNVWNYLFGGVSNFELRSQMEFLDALFFWGILGSFSYVYFYYRSFFQIKLKNILSIYILILILLITLLAGNFFYNTSVVIYMIILRESLVDSKFANWRNNKEIQS